MRCKCGYSFSQEVLGKDACGRQSYAVINDKHYRAFIRMEAKVLQARGEEKQRAIARSAKYVGSLHECPQCSRLLLVRPVKPGVFSQEFFKRDGEEITISKSKRTGAPTV